MTAATAGTAQRTAPVRVLVCDDQALVRTGFATIIGAQTDLEVVGECGDGRAAVDLAHRLDPDVVVMDVRMPVLDGIEATRLLAGPAAGHPVKVLVVTTFNLDEYVYEALRAGASGFLLKDAPPAQLLHGIRTVASGAALLAPEVTRQLVGRYATRIRPVEGTPVDSALTPREMDVLRLIAEGLSNGEIAATLVLSQETVKTYVSRILAKAGPARPRAGRGPRVPHGTGHLSPWHRPTTRRPVPARAVVSRGRRA